MKFFLTLAAEWIGVALLIGAIWWLVFGEEG